MWMKISGRLTEGVSGIFKAFEGEKVNGLGLMSGIQGGFAGEPDDLRLCSLLL
jgi:hypothetical protein